MKQYLDLVRTILEQGSWQQNRTGIRTLSMPGAMLKFDLQQGFPAITTKKLAFKSSIGEMVGFLRGARSAADFRALGCKVWDQNANENAQWLGNPYRLGEDDLGSIYGVQWRQWPAFKLLDPLAPGGEAQLADARERGYVDIAAVAPGTPGVPGGGIVLYKAIDQLRQCLDTIHANPADRRILFHGWNCAQLEEMALPPCHLLYQFLVASQKSEISMCVYIRSNDIALGTPFNICGAAALLHLVGRLTGHAPRWLTIFIGDAHIYENHVGMLEQQLQREPYALPRLVISGRIPEFAATRVYEPQWLERVQPGDFTLEGYVHHPALSASMAV